MSDKHDYYCLAKKSGFKSYYSGGKRVSKSEFYKRYPDFDEKNCILTQHKKVLKQDIETVQSIKDQLERCIYNLEESNKRYNKLNIAKEEEYYPKILNLKREVSNCEQNIKKYKEQIQNLNMSSQNYNKELKQKQKVIDNLVKDIENGKLDIQKLDSSINLFKIENQDLKSQFLECSKRSEELKEELKDVLVSMEDYQKNKDLIQDLEQQVRTLNERLILTESQKSTLEEIISEKEEELKRARALKDSEEVKKLQEELGDFNVESVLKMKNDLEESKKRIEELEGYLNEVYDEIKESDLEDEKDSEKEKEELKDELVKELKQVLDEKNANDFAEEILEEPNFSQYKDELKLEEKPETLYDYFSKKFNKFFSFGQKEIEKKIDDKFNKLKSTDLTEQVKEQVKETSKKAWHHKYKPALVSMATVILATAASRSMLSSSSLSDKSVSSISYGPINLNFSKFESELDKMVGNKSEKLNEIINIVVDTIPYQNTFTNVSNFPEWSNVSNMPNVPEWSNVSGDYFKVDVSEPLKTFEKPSKDEYKFDDLFSLYFQ
jgi:hypothetical protein